jgi:hypothetical protein
MLTNHKLRAQIEKYLLPEFASLASDIIYIPLGPKVEEAFEFAVGEGLIKQKQILGGLPHPSGANAERIAYFLNEKPEEQLSAKTNPKKIDEARKKILTKVACI